MAYIPLDQESKVKGKAGFSTLPGANSVYNYNTKTWDKIYNAPSSITGNWILVVNKNSKNKKLAFEFSAFMTSKEMSTKHVAISGNAVNPSRYSHFKDYDSWTKSGFTKQSAKRYLNEISKSLTNDNIVYDITLPGAGRYYQALDNAVYDALKGKLSPKEALKKAAKSWDDITDSIGRQAQLNYYKESLNR
jgi:multiple sugar transport system substrate-binding protein